MKYTLKIHKDEATGWYTGQCIQVPGAISQGETFQELMENMEDAIRMILEYKRDTVVDFPLPEKCFYRPIYVI